MSQSTAVPTDAPTREEEQPELLSFTLNVASPSLNSPLSFPRLPATTTVKELKARIRDVLPSKPTDEGQRLIHRGRMLSRETETMLDLFGKDTLETPDLQTLHLVLRPIDGASTQAVAPITRSQAATPNPLVPQPRPQSTPAIAGQGMHTQQPLPGFQQVQQHQVLHQAEQYHNMMTQRLHQLQHETQRLQREMGAIEQRHRAAQVAATGGVDNLQPAAPIQTALGVPPQSQGMYQLPHLGLRPPQGMPPSVQNLIAQQQQNRAADGRNGAQDTAGQGTAGPIRSASGRASPNIHQPSHTTTYTREGIGPNGQRWQVVVNETTINHPMAQTHHHFPGHHHIPTNPALDIQAVLRNADRAFAAQNHQAAHNTMRRSASESAPPTSTQPGSSSQGRAAAESSNITVTNASSSTPSLLNPPSNTIPSQNLSTSNSQSVANAASASSNEPMVYLLSSPQGPRALLLSNSETFFTPRQPSRRHRLDTPAGNLGQAQGQGRAPIGLPEFRNRPANYRANRRNPHNAEQPEQANAPNANPPGAREGGQVLAAVWLAIRLIVFIWFFASGNTSWTRWFMVSGLAFIVFLINTGFLQGVPDAMFGPIRRHLENLIPLAGPEAALVPAANVAIPQPGAVQAPADGNEPTPAPQAGEPSSALPAARLNEQRRRANGGWLMAQVRRAEHSLLLFLASLVPGVGERHIAHREAEASAAEAERQRLIEAAAAAENSEDVGEGTGAEGRAENSGENQPAQGDEARNEDAAAIPVAPLVEI